MVGWARERLFTIDMAKNFSALLLALCLILFFITPLQANAQAEVRNYLTIEILESKTHNLTQQEGRDTIDLSNLIIDLANTDSEFSQSFYQEIDNAVSRAGSPIGLNFNNSIVQGDFKLKQLGIASAVGEGALSTLFTPLEQEKINRYYPIETDIALHAPRVNIFRGSLYFDRTVFTGKIDGSDSLYLQSITANASTFQENSNFSQATFAKKIDFSSATFHQNANFIKSHFFSTAKFNSAEFQKIIDFNNAQFETLAEFKQTLFLELADFTRSVFIDTVDLSQSIFRDRLIFAKSKFLNSLLLVNTSFEKTVTLRDIYLNSLIDLQDAHLLNRLDFSNAFFTPQASINVSGLAFDATESKILGQPGIIGKYLQINRLQGNETVFRNLIRNFRSLEQITDANNLEYEQKQLQEREISDRLTKTSWRKVLTWGWINLVPQWLILNLLLLLGNYGTSISLIFSIGIITITFFSFLFWLIDRYRPHISQPIIPRGGEAIVMSISYMTFNILSIINIFIATEEFWLTMSAIAIFLLPIPIIITSLIYQRGRYHKLLDRSYFVENAEFQRI